MKMLSEMLRPYVGQYVGVQLLKGANVVSIAGEVMEREGEIVFLRERSSQPGQPKMVMTPGGPQAIPGEEKIVPRSVVHIGNISEEDVVLIEETVETREEAAAALGAQSAQKESMISEPSPHDAARFAKPSFIAK